MHEIAAQIDTDNWCLAMKQFGASRIFNGGPREVCMIADTSSFVAEA
jgi:hypothetical protein